MKKYYTYIPFLAILFSVVIFFYPFVFRGQLPIPSDTIVGLYHPFRDLYADTNPNGLPYKNFLVTDPVRQQYPWKNLSTMLEKQGILPLWNPYEMAGTPLLGNFQSSPFYPLNLLLFIPPFSLSWSFFIMLQPILAGIFLYLYLRNLRINSWASLFGSFTWALCGFSIAWMEWGIIGHTALWLPLILLSIDKMTIAKGSKLLWLVIYLVAVTSSFLAGHLQTFFYLYVISFIYFIARLYSVKKRLRPLFLFMLLNVLFLILSIPQWYPAFQFIALSGRTYDQTVTSQWFIPVQNLIQFLSPDFFGNPATLNYYGTWNYGEFIGYIGIAPLILALYAVLFRHDKKKWFFLGFLLMSLLFATRNIISYLPFDLHLPFLSSSQPSRLLFVVDICLAILAALGLDLFLKRKKYIWVPALIIGILFLGLWVTVILGSNLFPSADALLISKSNLKLPTLVLGLSVMLLVLYEFVKDAKSRKIIFLILFVVVLFDLFRFGWKYTPFTEQKYLYPETSTIRFLQSQPGIFRIATSDNRILAPNFSVMYHLQSIEGYDPLYMNSYAEFIAANEREDHSIKPPFGYSRIITPKNLNTQAIDLLNVKYVLSLDELSATKFKKVHEEGRTKVYENTQVLPRAFFVEQVLNVSDRKTAAQELYKNDLSQTAIVVDSTASQEYTVGAVEVTRYEPNTVIMKTNNIGEGFLILTDTYYPTFHATIDGKDTQIIQVDLTFRGIKVPKGQHEIIYQAKLF